MMKQTIYCKAQSQIAFYVILTLIDTCQHTLDYIKNKIIKHIQFVY